jgi:hypothetical protein
LLPEISKLAKAKNPPILDLGMYAKLKGVVSDPSLSLHALAGVVLQHSFSLPYHTSYPWNLSPALHNDLLYRKIDCQWCIYAAIDQLNDLGLLLQPTQATKPGQLVTIV